MDMKTITINKLIEIAEPGDLLLTSNPDGLGTVIRWFQELEGDEAIYTHVAIMPQKYVMERKKMLIEANKVLDYRPIAQYIGKRILLIRHKDMTPETYRKGYKEIKDNLGQKYPYWRLLLHAIDNFSNYFLRLFHVKPLVHVARLVKIDYPVCSEWAAQFLLEADLDLTRNILPEMNIKEWGGINPDHFDDWSQMYPMLWERVFEGRLLK